jgi:type I restriction enzyme M protein
MPDAQELTYIERAIADGYAEITGEGKSERIHYKAAEHSERWGDPEEKVRAEFWAELILKYEYRPERIRLEVNVPRRTPNDYADLVIYTDDERKSPYFVFGIFRLVAPCCHPFIGLSVFRAAKYFPARFARARDPHFPGFSCFS